MWNKKKYENINTCLSEEKRLVIRARVLWKKLIYARKIARMLYTPITLTSNQIKIVHDISEEGIACDSKKYQYSALTYYFDNDNEKDQTNKTFNRKDTLKDDKLIKKVGISLFYFKKFFE